MFLSLMGLRRENEMIYKNYRGTIEFSDADRCYFGKVVNINSLISYEGNSIEEFYNILEKNMRPVYDSARRQGYDVWDFRR